jgi:hypothetical protein
MAEAALCQLWGGIVPGREKEALNVYSETMQWWAGRQQEGKIERFDVTVLSPTGGDASGFLIARGTAQQIDSLRRTKEYAQRAARVQLCVSHFRIADAYVDEGIAELMGQFQEVIEQAV